ncbi:MAG: glycosyltransferase family 2 protein [Caldilineaceae bacterium]
MSLCEKPAISVIVPTYNRAACIERSIRSILSQTWSDFEVIIVDDGSTDETQQVITTIDDLRLRYHYQSNRGVSAARNAGVMLAKSKLLVFLDSDDEAQPDWLQQIACTFETDNQIGIVCGGVIIRELGQEFKRLPRQLGAAYHYQTGLFAAGTFALRKVLFDQVGGYAESLAFSENTELALRLIPCCLANGWTVASIYRPLIIYHREPLRWARSQDKFRLRLQSAQYILDHHGEKYRGPHPAGYANYCVIAGVNAARLGWFRQARSYFIAAIQVNPFNWRHYVRLFLSLVPSVGNQFWLRHQEVFE